jgi:hypothetical protein
MESSKKKPQQTRHSGNGWLSIEWHPTNACNAIERHDTWWCRVTMNIEVIYSSERRRAAGLVTFRPNALALKDYQGVSCDAQSMV